METTTKEYKYFAFISYNSRDGAWGKRLQSKLESYKMSATLCKQHGWARKPMRKIFFAPTDIQPGNLRNELKERLKASKNLIVICSPNSVKSEWVGWEIETFYQLRKAKNIFFFIVDGVPNSGDPATECFSPSIKKLGLSEDLGTNIHEKNYCLPWLNRELAYVKLITKLLGIEVDEVWQRHKRMLVRNMILWALGTIMVIAALFGTWYANRSIDVSMRVAERSERNEHLPLPHNAIVSVEFENETKVDTLATLDEEAVFVNVPQRFVGKEVKVSVSCADFLPLDTIILLAPNSVLGLHRNPAVYGEVKARVYKSLGEGLSPLPGQTIRIGGREAVSDNEGRIRLEIPLKEQRTGYKVLADVPLETDSITMPCGNYEAIIVK